MPLRPAHLAATRALALPRLPPISDRDKDIETPPCTTRCRSCHARLASRRAPTPTG
ncbi:MULTISPECIES: hypothetical protein [Streptomyces]|uniref:hypothetical protein n=1 Tax=Streptomyces TaxID=1883 RepID=UPI002DD7A246|nr:hypothetical protein [Streptomyces hirsutus]